MKISSRRQVFLKYGGNLQVDKDNIELSWNKSKVVGTKFKSRRRLKAKEFQCEEAYMSNKCGQLFPRVGTGIYASIGRKEGRNIDD